MTVAELVTHLSRIHDQGSLVLIRIQHHQLGQLDLYPADITLRPDGAYVIEHEDPWADDERWPEDPDTKELL
ncbi:hypothetical protein [Actinomyces naeslundii]